jgi:HK97 family phage prohead protease
MEAIRRSLPSEVAAGSGRILRGLIPYNAPTVIVERGKRFTEVIRPGAFARALAGARDVIATFNHNPDRLLGRTGSGTLKLTDTPGGLAYEVELPESAADVRELLARGDLGGSSFTAFPLADGGQKWTRDVRELLALEVVELGPVVSPAYPTSSAEVRSGEASPPPAGRSRLARVRVELMKRTV